MFSKSYTTRYIRVILQARSWKKIPMKLLKWKKKMSARDQEYDLVTNDEFDTRIPLHPDEAFTYGITFDAKYIGTMEVPRPTSRVEIVAAMRRVRYEFKARGVKKRKVTFDVSIDGVRVTTRSKAACKRKKKTTFFGRKTTTILENVEVMHHPIYRIFYVSHDSSDLKIFSYIARDGATNGFKCNVFKSNRKSQAMRIVRTVGQAFEVCHKMQVNSPGEPAQSTSSAVDEAAPSCSDVAASKEVVSECGVSDAAETAVAVAAAAVPKTENGVKDIKEEPVRPTHLDLLPPPPKKEGKKMRSVPPPNINLPDLPECIITAEVVPEPTADASTPLSSQHQLQLLRERLDQQTQQTRAAVAQLLLLRDQLAAEQAARCEAQARTHQLLEHNKELLEHIAALVAHLQDRERGSRPISAHQLTLLPQMPENLAACTGILSNSEELIDLLTPNNNQLANHCQPNNGARSPSAIVPSFADMSDEQIQEYLIDRFQEMGGFPSQSKSAAKTSFNANQQFFQNRQAFPNIPPLVSHYSNADLQSLLDNGQAQAMSVGHSNSSLFAADCPTSPDSSKDSSDSSSEEENSFIKPLSHKGTLTATGVDGRVRLIVPVSPSESVSEVGEVAAAAAAAPVSNTLTVAPVAPILRTTSEKVPHRSELMAAMRQQWTRHTTK